MYNPDDRGRPRQFLDVVVVGEAVIDVVISPEKTSEYPGGSPANVAYGLGKLGVTTGLLTSIGDDERGAAIHRHLDGAGVTLLPGSYSRGKTPQAKATLAADGSTNYETTDIIWELAPVAPAYVPKIFHTGSIAAFLSPGAEAVQSLLKQCHQDCTVTYDPKVGPELLGSHAEATSIFEDFVAMADVVKLSDHDAQWLYPRKELDEVAAHILALGAGLAAITQGSKGSLLTTPDARINIPSVKSVVTDTIGAGDAYMSALILGLLTRGSSGFAPSIVEQIGRMAAMAAAITVRRRGANPPSQEELRAHLEHPPRDHHR